MKYNLTQKQLMELIKESINETSMADFEAGEMRRAAKAAQKQREKEKQLKSGVQINSDVKKKRKKKVQMQSAESFENSSINSLIEKLEGIFEYRGKHNTTDKAANAIKRITVVYTSLAEKNSAGGSFLTDKNREKNRKEGITKYNNIYENLRILVTKYNSIKSYLHDYGKLDRDALSPLYYRILDFADVLSPIAGEILNDNVVRNDKSPFMVGDGGIGKNPGFKPTLEYLKHAGSNYLSSLCGEIVRLKDELSNNDVMSDKFARLVSESIVNSIKKIF